MTFFNTCLALVVGLPLAGQVPVPVPTPAQLDAGVVDDALDDDADADADADVGVADAGPIPIAPREAIDADDADGADDGGVVDTDAGVLDDFALQARVEPARVPFGGEVELVVSLRRGPRLRTLIPDDLGASEALPRTRKPPLRETHPRPDGDVDEVFRFSFLALDVKDLKTPAFVIHVGERVLEVPALPVAVEVAPLPDITDGGAPDGALVVEAAADTIVYPVADERPWALLALMAGAAFILLALRKLIALREVRRPMPVGPPPPPPRPAHEVALERLEALMPLLANGDVTAFVERLMDEVLRDYLTARFALSAGTRTTKEIVTDLLSVTVVGLDVTLVERLGQDTDLMKFARAHLGREQAHGMAGRVRALIESTAEKAPTAGTTTTPPSGGVQ